MLAAAMRPVVVALLALGAGCSRPNGKTPVGLELRERRDSVAARSQPARSDDQVRYDQLGYRSDPELERYAVVLSSGGRPPHFRIVEASTQRVVGEGAAGPRLLQATSRAGTPLMGDRIDLAKLPVGSYFVVLDDGVRAGPIRIAADPYASVLPLVAQFLAEQRCGPTTKSVSLHGACHLFRSIYGAHSGDGLAVDDGASPPYAAATPVDAEGGWHDAGDYLKFALTTSYVLAVELMALRDHRTALGKEGDRLARELRWGLDWLLKMESGAEPYHQVGGEGDHDPDWRLPETDTANPIPAYDHRPVFRMASGRGRNVLGRSAAAFALASQVYESDSHYAGKLLRAAKATYALAKKRAGVQNPDPPDFYDEDSAEDDLLLGAAVLARATGETRYSADTRSLGARLTPTAGTPVGWRSVDALALLEAGRAFPGGSTERSELARKLDALAAPIAATARSPAGPGAAFGYALPSFGNGSVAESLGAAATCLAARRLSGAAGCETVAWRQLHWLFGENPFGLSFLVGAGTAWPRQLHHSFGQAAHLTIPGAIAGGPTSLATLTGGKLPPPPKDDPFAKWSTDEVLYEDNESDYICNEPAIDFAAALVFSLAELEGAETARPGRSPLKDGR
jgi:endoglucanase